MPAEEKYGEFLKQVTRYLSGEMSAGEKEDFLLEASRVTEKQDLLDEYRRVWDSAESGLDPEMYDLDAEWDLLQRKLPGTGKRVLFYLYRVAAVLVVGVLFAFAWLYWNNLKGTERIAATDEPVEVTLGDGSVVTVNTDSWIRIRRHPSEFDRTVILEGEAWFEVVPDSTKPFRVAAGKALIEVLGTSFNVNAYRRNEEVEITVESGVVALAGEEDRNNQIVLRAGNGGTFHKKDNKLTLIPDPDPNKISWKTRELYFDNTPLKEVAEVVGRAYHVHLIIPDPSLADCPITVNFKEQSLESVLKVLEMTMGLEVSRTGDEIRLNGEGCEQ